MFDEAAAAAIIAALRLGLYFSTACRLAGAAPSTGRDWVQKGRAGDARYEAFSAACDQATAQAEVELLARLRGAGPHWKAYAWMLERRFPQRWAPRDRTSQPPRPSKPLKKMSNDELDRYEAELMGAG